MAVEHAEVTGGDPGLIRERLGIAAAAPVIGHLATLDPNKGSTDLIRAVARINAGRPSSRAVQLLMAGTTSPDFERFLAEYPGGAASWLRLLGVLSNEDRKHFYAALDVFSMPSRTDSFGIVFLEAWANGVPVVAAAAGGVPEVVQQGKTGLLVPFAAVQGLADALDSLLTNPLLARSMGETGRAWSTRDTPGTTVTPRSPRGSTVSSRIAAPTSPARVDPKRNRRAGPPGRNLRRPETPALRRGVALRQPCLPGLPPRSEKGASRPLYRHPACRKGMVQKQVTAQGWLMSTPEGDAPDPTLTRWGLAGCRQLDPQPSRSCHSRRSAC